LELARKHAEKELEINAQSASGNVLLAESHLLQAEWESSQNKNPASWLDRALRLLDEAEKIDPALADAFAIRGKIYLLQAGLVPSVEKLKVAEKAKQSFDRTLAMNRNLQRLYSPDLAKAAKLLSP
jgi:hypothetical protein